MKLRLGHHIYGLAVIFFGIITLIWHQINSLGNISHPVILVYVAGIIELIAGLAIQWQRTVRFGALTIGIIFLIFSLFLIPPIFEMPLVYYTWGNFFEELSIVLGSVFVFASTFSNDPKFGIKIERAAYVVYGICVISYSVYQLFYLPYTAGLVPKWIPPGQMFWAVSTSIAFALAAVAIFSGRQALLASGLLTTMFISFCLIVWLPKCISDPSSLTYWFSNDKTLAVAGTAWIVTDFLSQPKFSSLTLPFIHKLIKGKKN
jgi:uncharacterized membrane protein YphA (DoxX/SURF4 family)